MWWLKSGTSISLSIMNTDGFIKTLMVPGMGMIRQRWNSSLLAVPGKTGLSLRSNGTSMNKIKQEDAIAFMKSGKAGFVLHTLKTNKQFKYKVRKKSDTLWWVYTYESFVVQCSPIYIGFIAFSNFAPAHQTNNLTEDGLQAVELFDYCWTKLKTLEVPERLHILHLGACGRCGRPLTDARSLELGIGPECIKRI